ncbi:hypothetical protein BC937DRAFT_87449 [Endogone sp. FLAS-F59071]|nr:hypothetical protein BC937DRAFT_87449 [Endogone sp. FLAS-F59071]|eukprot:RUS19453.1 hypothetical protein BC937DRAFT_87449 [Endogone sp. FLAS-F59071]
MRKIVIEYGFSASYTPWFRGARRQTLGCRHRQSQRTGCNARDPRRARRGGRKCQARGVSIGNLGVDTQHHRETARRPRFGLDGFDPATFEAIFDNALLKYRTVARADVGVLLHCVQIVGKGDKRMKGKEVKRFKLKRQILVSKTYSLIGAGFRVKHCAMAKRREMAKRMSCASMKIVELDNKKHTDTKKDKFDFYTSIHKFPLPIQRFIANKAMGVSTRLVKGKLPLGVIMAECHYLFFNHYLLCCYIFHENIYRQKLLTNNI